MSSIKTIEILTIDDLFDMHGGFVLNFSDRTFATFFTTELGVDIDDAAYRADGPSKAKRLRCFLRTVDNPTAVRTLRALWDYREALRARTNEEDKAKNAQSRFLELIKRLEPGAQLPPNPLRARSSKLTADRLAQLRTELLELSNLAPQPRGYAFEKFLKELFDAYGLEARQSFRLKGEQIDGSFQLANETYLLEARWQNALTDAAELRAFNGKVVEKVAWARGLFISYSGFSADGLFAFGRGKHLICMDGLDLHETMNRALVLGDVLEKKVRRSVETGSPFARVIDLFPS